MTATQAVAGSFAILWLGLVTWAATRKDDK